MSREHYLGKLAAVVNDLPECDRTSAGNYVHGHAE